MKISIVCASYNNIDTIDQTIQSIRDQTYDNVEHVIIDGGSTDGTLERIKSYPHISKIISEPDKGIYDALNKGVKLADGDYIGIIGADDFFPHNEVLNMVAAGIKKHKTDSIYGDIQYVDAVNTEKMVRYWKAGEFKQSNFKLGWMPPHLSFYLKKETYLKYGLYDISFRSSGDYELMLRMLYKHKISTAYIPEVLMNMRTGGTSNASLKNRIIANNEDYRAWIINDLKPSVFTRFLKPLLKIPQLFASRK